MTAQATSSRKRLPFGRMTRRERKEAFEGYLFISPWFFGFLIFTAGPMLYSLWLSFNKWGLIDETTFIGLDNFVKMYHDPIFWHSLWVTTRFTMLSVPLRIVLALALATLLVKPLRGVYLFRAIYYLPAVIGGVVVALLWMWVFNPEYGIANYLLSLIGIQGPRWLADPDWAIWAIVIMSAWSLGTSMILFIAGLQAIPPQLYEVADLDGAGPWMKYRHVTLPMLSPTLLFVLITSIIGSFQVFDIVFISTSGGPVRSTLVYLMYFYQQGFSRFNMGYASALVWVLMVIILALTAIIFKSSSFWVFYEAEK